MIAALALVAFKLSLSAQADSSAWLGRSVWSFIQRHDGPEEEEIIGPSSQYERLMKFVLRAESPDTSVVSQTKYFVWTTPLITKCVVILHTKGGKILGVYPHGDASACESI